MYVNEGGTLYGFCPGKVTWDHNIVGLYKILVIVAETGIMPNGDSLLEQEERLIDVLFWFIPAYKKHQFNSNAEMIFGSDKQSKGKGSYGDKRGITNQGKRR